MELTEKIDQLLQEKYTGDELFADCFTVAIELKPGQKLYVFVDSDSGMTFEKCKILSRYLEQFIDTNGWLGEKYVLEVSSPGIERPLQFLRQYEKNIGRSLQVSLKDKTQKSGVLKSAQADHIVLEWLQVEKIEKKKVETLVETQISMDEIEKAVVQIVF
ncbi:MAG: ribosome maturation factor [Bacteroidetes bacterium]|nr:ribosome maturation factor [Bacteroidota bacterium]